MILISFFFCFSCSASNPGGRGGSGGHRRWHTFHQDNPTPAPSVALISGVGNRPLLLFLFFLFFFWAGGGWLIFFCFFSLLTCFDVDVDVWWRRSPVLFFFLRCRRSFQGAFCLSEKGSITLPGFPWINFYYGYYYRSLIYDFLWWPRTRDLVGKKKEERRRYPGATPRLCRNIEREEKWLEKK